MEKSVSTVRLTCDELLALIGLYEVPSYPGVPEASIESDDADARSGAGARSLIARELVTIQTEPETLISPTPSLGPVISPLIPPVAAAVIQQMRPDDLQTEIWWLEMDSVTQQISDDVGITTFTTMSPEDGHALLTAWLGVDDRPAPAGDAFDVTWADILDVFRDFLGESADRTRSEVEAGNRLADLRSGTRWVNRVEMLWQPEADRQEMVAVIWVDRGEEGCWLIDPVEVGEGGTADRFRVEPIAPLDAFEIVKHGIPGLVDATGE